MRRLPAVALALTTASPLPGALPLTVAAGIAAGALVPVAAMAEDFRFSAVKIEGNKRIEPATILAYAKVAKGQTVSGDQLNDAYQRLVGSGLFETVDLVPQGGTLVIRVKEYPMVGVVAFEGNRVLKDDAIAKSVKTKPNHVFSPAQVEADANLIAEGYTQAGRINVRVDPKVIRRGDDRVDVAFEIKEGYTSEVHRISFTGNRSYSDFTLRQALSTKQAGILHRLIQSDNFVPDRLEQDKQNLIDFYQSRGYPDVKVTGISSDMARARDGYFVTFNIEEGQQYKFGNITTVSEVPDLNVDEFAPLAKIKTGSVYTPTAIDLAITRMEQLALKKGANFVRVDPRVTRDPATQTLNVQFALVRGPRIFVERIDIKGNTTTLDSVIRREFRTDEGDPFNPREIRNSADRIRALGFFSKADVNTKPGTNPDQVVVDVNVEEQPTGSLTLGASYGAASGFGVLVGVQEDNFLGRGQSLGVQIGTTADNQQSSIDFVEPYFLGRDVKARMHLWYDTTSNDNADYNTRIQGLQPSVEFPVAENSRLEARYAYGKKKLFGVTDYTAASGTTSASGSSPVLSYEQSLGERTASSVGYTYTWDTMTTNLDPRYGYTFKFGQDYYGLGGDVDAISTTALLAAQRKVMHESVRLRAELEGGVITPRSGSDLTILDRFSGYGKVRGFESHGWGPRDVGAPNGDALGGQYFWALRTETEFPIGLPEEYGITGGLFWDTGALWGVSSSERALAMGLDDSDKMHIRSAVGFSFFWRSALGPLRIDFSKAIKKETYDKEQNFDLTISTKF